MVTTGSRADFGVILNQDLPEQDIPELLRQSTFLSAKENTAFVRLFESKEILIDFLNAVLRRSDEDVITEVEHMNRDLAVIYPSDDIVSVDVFQVMRSLGIPEEKIEEAERLLKKTEEN